MAHTKRYLPDYSLAEIEEMRVLIDAERYAEYHAYNWRHRGRDWSRHAANIVAGYGPDAAYVRAYLDSYFEGKLTESERRNMSAKIATLDFENIKNNDGEIPTDRDAVEFEVVEVMHKKLGFPLGAFPGTLTYGEMVGAEISDKVVNDEKVERATLAGLAAMRGASTEPPEGTVVDEHGVILDPNDEFGGVVGIQGDDVNWFEERALSNMPTWSLLALDLMYREHESDRPTATGTIPLGDRLVPSADKDVPGIPPTPLPPVPAPGSGDSRVSPPAPRSMSAPVEDKEAPTPALPISAPSPAAGEAREIAAPMPDLLHSLLPKLDRAPAIELPAGAMSAAPEGTEATIPPPLTPEQSQQRVAEAEAVLRQARTAESILETAIATATTILDGLRATHIRLAGGAELPSTIVAVSPAQSSSPLRSARPTLADTMPSARHESESERAGMDAATVKQLRRLVREEVREWQDRAAADYRSSGLFRYRG